jgi:hypothetical protein
MLEPGQAYIPGVGTVWDISPPAGRAADAPPDTTETVWDLGATDWDNKQSGHVPETIWDADPRTGKALTLWDGAVTVWDTGAGWTSPPVYGTETLWDIDQTGKETTIWDDAVTVWDVEI